MKKKIHGSLPLKSARRLSPLAAVMAVTTVCSPFQDAAAFRKEHKDLKAAKAANREQAAEEKIKVGGDVPVTAWTDSSLTPWASGPLHSRAGLAQRELCTSWQKAGLSGRANLRHRREGIRRLVED